MSETKSTPNFIICKHGVGYRSDLTPYCAQCQLEKVKRLQEHFHIPSPEISEVLCAKCMGRVIEFGIPNDIWNLVVRRGGPESSGEYLCYDCWITAVGAEVKRLKALVLTPGQFRALAHFILQHGELTNSQGLTALILRNMADDAAEAEGGTDGHDDDLV